MPPPIPHHQPSAALSPPVALRWIALYKFAKTLACVLLAMAAFHLLRADVADHFDRWLSSFTWAARHGLVAQAIDKLEALGPAQFRLVGATAITYAILYALEGVGLWLGKRWAAWLVVVESGLLLPFEGWSLWHHFSTFKLLLMLANVLVVLYLLHALHTHELGDGVAGEGAAE